MEIGIALGVAVVVLIASGALLYAMLTVSKRADDYAWDALVACTKHATDLRGRPLCRRCGRPIESRAAAVVAQELLHAECVLEEAQR